MTDQVHADSRIGNVLIVDKTNLDKDETIFRFVDKENSQKKTFSPDDYFVCNHFIACNHTYSTSQ